MTSTDDIGYSEEAMKELLATFGRAYFRADPEALAACTTEDFEWHQHTGEAPDGQVVRGVAEVCEVIKRRKGSWKVRYGDFETYSCPGMITSCFTIQGTDDKGEPVNVRAVDLYPVRDGKIARKDSFWKQIV